MPEPTPALGQVREILIQNGKAVGVVAEIEGERTEIKAPVVISTLPLKLLPENMLPPKFIRLKKIPRSFVRK